eukprot:CAMPEP_0198333300 /NCGR_PEP_ID=MMETSP1450-20131203/18869_1 /TAXON_ID=753684 ORGANISM="Madagascaria erythrocladiodes, Strain CCMP3234" /NCGR_SAMPLE_ID=MMETSP1450 /ASSEMBLY_ACC=CAM_ASM_001115 /LENGTH=297 /DNA_ID=CAMNT_0044037809 /DNA_START=71 /DNA_END=960 /DNA_ORIENTATION=+
MLQTAAVLLTLVTLAFAAPTPDTSIPDPPAVVPDSYTTAPPLRQSDDHPHHPHPLDALRAALVRVEQTFVANDDASDESSPELGALLSLWNQRQAPPRHRVPPIEVEIMGQEAVVARVRPVAPLEGETKRSGLASVVNGTLKVEVVAMRGDAEQTRSEFVVRTPVEVVDNEHLEVKFGSEGGATIEMKLKDPMEKDVVSDVGSKFVVEPTGVTVERKAGMPEKQLPRDHDDTADTVEVKKESLPAETSRKNLPERSFRLDLDSAEDNLPTFADRFPVLAAIGRIFVELFHAVKLIAG